MFGVFCLAMGIFIFFFVKETKGLSLEAMDILFGSVDEQQRKTDLEYALKDEEEKAAIAGKHTEHLVESVHK